jgi:hypothetical protein
VIQEMEASELGFDRLKTQLSEREKENATLVQEVVAKKLEVNELKDQIATINSAKKESVVKTVVQSEKVETGVEKKVEVKPLQSALKKVVDEVGFKRECPSPFVKKSKGIVMDEVVQEEAEETKSEEPDGYQYQALAPKKRLARKAKGGPGTSSREEECKQQ